MCVFIHLLIRQTFKCRGSCQTPRQNSVESQQTNLTDQHKSEKKNSRKQLHLIFKDATQSEKMRGDKRRHKKKSASER